jgi:hypothetical protein
MRFDLPEDGPVAPKQEEKRIIELCPCLCCAVLLANGTQ